MAEWEKLGERFAEETPKDKLLFFLGALLEEATPEETADMMRNLPAARPKAGSGGLVGKRQVRPPHPPAARTAQRVHVRLAEDGACRSPIGAPDGSGRPSAGIDSPRRPDQRRRHAISPARSAPASTPARCGPPQSLRKVAGSLMSMTNGSTIARDDQIDPEQPEKYRHRFASCSRTLDSRAARGIRDKPHSHPSPPTRASSPSGQPAEASALDSLRSSPRRPALGGPTGPPSARHTVGRPAACQAAKPPARSVARVSPRSCSEAAASELV